MPPSWDQAPTPFAGSEHRRAGLGTTVNIRHRARTLALASLLALALAGVPQGDAQAAVKCTATTCGTKTYTGGDIRSHRNVMTGQTMYFYCDGFTGEWVRVRSNSPSSETVSPQLPTTNGR
jgi:hypothetical protein